MIGWARIGDRTRWHQVDGQTERDWFRPSCDPDANYPTNGDVMDYRWRPPSGEQCRRPACQREVDP